MARAQKKKEMKKPRVNETDAALRVCFARLHALRGEAIMFASKKWHQGAL